MDTWRKFAAGFHNCLMQVEDESKRPVIEPLVIDHEKYLIKSTQQTATLINPQFNCPKSLTII